MGEKRRISAFSEGISANWTQQTKSEFENEYVGKFKMKPEVQMQYVDMV